MGLTMGIQKMMKESDQYRKHCLTFKEKNSANKPTEIKPTVDYMKLSQNFPQKIILEKNACTVLIGSTIVI